tara:strand:+ start:41 stop:523 length:483 start_codon:yes stop_codon:yes gene_type:complete
MLKGEKILLRSLIDSDLDILINIENNPDNWKFGSEKKIFTKKDLVNYISNSSASIKITKQYRFVIEFSDIPIGFIDLFNYTEKSCEVGVFILKKYRNKGFATDALKLIINYSFNSLKLDSIHCSIDIKNVPSNKLFNNCGFKFINQKNSLQYFIKLAKTD